MSYAGKTVRGRRNALRDEVASAALRRRASAPARPLDREVAVSSAIRRPANGADDTELDWQRVAIFATGALLGAAVGAGAALLLAPQSGEETRRDLMRQGRRFRARSADAWDDLRDELQWAARRGRRKLGRTLHNRRLRREEERLDQLDD